MGLDALPRSGIPCPGNAGKAGLLRGGGGMDSWNDVSGEWLGERESGFLFFLSFFSFVFMSF